MADTHRAGAMPAAFPHPAPESFDYLDADLNDAHHALQALLALLHGCAPEHPVLAGQLHALLQPIASSVQQAAHTLAVIHPHH